jgi:protein-tyrosine phosphatase
MSRSAAIVAAYLSSSEQHSMNADEALTWIRRARAIVRPNDQFMAQLRQFHVQVETQSRCKLLLNTQTYCY